MKKINSLICLLLLICNYTFAYQRIIYPMRSTSEFITEKSLVGWYDNTISISSTETNAGFSISLYFSTPEKPLNQSILSIGREWENTIDHGINIKENNSTLKMIRHVQRRNIVGFYESNAWNPNLLKRNTNYCLKVEIDETRLRYAIWEEGRPENKTYEYEFYGLESSYLKNVLSHSRLAYAVNPRYFPQELVIEELASGVGVEPVVPTPTVRWGYLINLNSQKYMRRYGSTSWADNIYQNSLSNTANEIWEMHPGYDSKRTPMAYNAILKNLYSEEYISPKDCSQGNNYPLKETSSTDCNEWKIEKKAKEANYFNIKNNHTNDYISVKDKSKEEMAPVVTSETVTGTECSWNFVDLNLNTPIETGYYSIQNKNSSKYLYTRYNSIDVGEYIVQHSYTKTNQNLWYIEKQPGGFYTISNMDSKLYMEVEGKSFSDGAYITQGASSEYAHRKWIIKKSSDTNTYTIQSLASGKYLVVQNASTAEDAYAIQYSGGQDNKLWILKKENFTPLPSTWTGLGGVYKIKNFQTGLYLVVKNASTTPGAYIIGWDNGDTPNAWWSVIQKDNGTWLIKNVNSQQYLNVKGNSMEEGANIIQWNDPDKNTGNSLWNIIPSMIRMADVFLLKNVRSGKYVHVKNDSQTPGAWITQNFTESFEVDNNKTRWRFTRVDPPASGILSLKSNSTDNQDDLISLASELKVYSIADNVFKISSNNKKMHQIQIMSVTGQLLNQYSVGDIQYELNLNNKTTGVYLLNVIYDDKSSETRKVLVK